METNVKFINETHTYPDTDTLFIEQTRNNGSDSMHDEEVDLHSKIEVFRALSDHGSKTNLTKAGDQLYSRPKSNVEVVAMADSIDDDIDKLNKDAKQTQVYKGKNKFDKRDKKNIVTQSLNQKDKDSVLDQRKTEYSLNNIDCNQHRSKRRSNQTQHYKGSSDSPSDAHRLRYNNGKNSRKLPNRLKSQSKPSNIVITRKKSDYIEKRKRMKDDNFNARDEKLKIENSKSSRIFGETSKIRSDESKLYEDRLLPDETGKNNTLKKDYFKPYNDRLRDDETSKRINVDQIKQNKFKHYDHRLLPDVESDQIPLGSFSQGDLPKKDSIEPFNGIKPNEGREKNIRSHSNKNKNDKGSCAESNRDARSDLRSTPNYVVVGVPKSASKLVIKRRYHVHISEPLESEAWFNSCFNIGDNYDVNLKYEGPVKITPYYLSNKYE